MSPDQTEQMRIEIVGAIPALRRFARTFVHNDNDVDDLVQETLLKALASIASFTPGTCLKAWLFTILRNTFFTRYRLAAREQPGHVEDCALISIPSQPTQEWSLQGKELARAVERLTGSKRTVCELILIEGRSYEAAALEMKCATGTIKSRVNRVRKILAQELDY